MAEHMLTADDVEPGVAPTVEMISVEANFADGTKMVIVFKPIGPGQDAGSEAPEPGAVITPEGEIKLNAGRPNTVLDVVNTGDRDIQVRSHTHFFEVNPALDFVRARAFGMRLDVLSGGGVRFEPGLRKRVTLVPMARDRIVKGQAGLTQGPLDKDAVRQAAFAAARAGGYRGI
jgi:urease subunit gamma/beta